MTEGNHVIEPPTRIVEIVSKGIADVTVAALRDHLIALEPSRKEDIDRYIEQLRELQGRYLIAIASDPVETCKELGVKTGKLKAETVAALALRLFDERKAADDREFSRKQLFWSIVFSALLSSLMTWLITGSTAS